MTATLERRQGIDSPVYLDVDGERWRVHDTVFRNGKHLRTPLPSSRATHRIFVNEKGTRRSYQFTRGENRQLAATALEAQLRRAKYLGTVKRSSAGNEGPFGGPPPGGALT